MNIWRWMGWLRQRTSCRWRCRWLGSAGSKAKALVDRTDDTKTAGSAPEEQGWVQCWAVVHGFLHPWNRNRCRSKPVLGCHDSRKQNRYGRKPVLGFSHWGTSMGAEVGMSLATPLQEAGLSYRHLVWRLNKAKMRISLGHWDQELTIASTMNHVPYL